MPLFLYPVISVFILVIALSIDAFLASFAYGVDKIRIPVSSMAVISLISGLSLGASLLLGRGALFGITEEKAGIISFFLLFLVGFIKLFDSVVKCLIRSQEPIKRNLNFHMFNLKFILTVYADPDRADADKGGILSPREAVSLGIALSIDSMAAGVGAGLANAPVALSVGLCIITGALAVILGARLGNKIAERFSMDFSWISGLLLIILAFTKVWNS